MSVCECLYVSVCVWACLGVCLCVSGRVSTGARARVLCVCVCVYSVYMVLAYGDVQTQEQTTFEERALSY